MNCDPGTYQENMENRDRDNKVFQVIPEVSIKLAVPKPPADFLLVSEFEVPSATRFGWAKVGESLCRGFDGAGVSKEEPIDRGS